VALVLGAPRRPYSLNNIGYGLLVYCCNYQICKKNIVKRVEIK
jgi:hypothetical protein